MAWAIFGRPVRREHGRAERLVVGDVGRDPTTGWVAVGGWLVGASVREAQLLEQLMRHPRHGLIRRVTRGQHAELEAVPTWVVVGQAAAQGGLSS